MDALPSRPRPVPPRPHWTEPVSREETLARREKFQKIGWLPPNHKPKTKKVIATAKRLWDKYCEHIGVDADSHLLEGQHHDFESWIDWINRTTKKKTHDSISIYWKWLCQVYSILAKQPMDCFTTEQVRRVRRVPFDQLDDIPGLYRKTCCEKQSGSDVWPDLEEMPFPCDRE